MLEERPSVHLDTCLGCGHCVDACETHSISLEVDYSRIPEYKEPGVLKTAFALSLTAMMFLLFIGYKSTHKNENYKYGKAKPRQSDLVCLNDSV